jgi:hypothetical protein
MVSSKEVQTIGSILPSLVSHHDFVWQIHHNHMHCNIWECIHVMWGFWHILSMYRSQINCPSSIMGNSRAYTNQINKYSISLKDLPTPSPLEFSLMSRGWAQDNLNTAPLEVECIEVILSSTSMHQNHHMKGASKTHPKPRKKKRPSPHPYPHEEKKSPSPGPPWPLKKKSRNGPTFNGGDFAFLNQIAF